HIFLTKNRPTGPEPKRNKRKSSTLFDSRSLT
ncbi:MAG: hypothetical protein ACI81T_004286, partial [Bacteroidia bacterium]